MKPEQNDTIISLFNNLKIEIGDNGYVRCDTDWNAKGVFSPYSRFYYIIDGEGSLFCRGNEIKMKKNMLYFVPLGVKFSYNCPSYLTKIYFHINISLPDKYDLFSDCDEILSLESNNIEEIINCYKNDTVADAIKLNNLLCTDILRIFSAAGCGSVQIPTYSDTVRKAIQYINFHLSSKLNIKEISEDLFISESKLVKAFRTETGKSIGKYINDRIMFELEKTLVCTNRPINEISDLYGFCDSFYLSRKFKEYTGFTPSEYRQKMQKIHS